MEDRIVTEDVIKKAEQREVLEQMLLGLLDDPQVQQKIVTLLRRWPLAYPKSNPSLEKLYSYKAGE